MADNIRWRKSLRSGSNGGACVEVATVERVIVVRDSKDPKGPMLTFAARDWTSFVKAVKRGQFDR